MVPGDKKSKAASAPSGVVKPRNFVDVNTVPPTIGLRGKRSFAENLVLSLLESFPLRWLAERSKRNSKLQAEKLRNILFFSNWGLGDAVMQTTTVELLHKKFPRAHIFLVATPRVIDVWAGHPDLMGKSVVVGKKPDFTSSGRC
jgi:hypothetical protein